MFDDSLKAPFSKGAVALATEGFSTPVFPIIPRLKKKSRFKNPLRFALPP